MKSLQSIMWKYQLFAGYLITRSSLNRNGIFIQSGLYDSNFYGYVGCTLYNLGGRIKIRKNTRIAQFILVQAESTSEYKGSYNQVKLP